MADGGTESSAAFDPASITRPDESLLTYYLIVSLATLVAAPIAFVPLYIKYRTMRYRLDEEGISMSWGYFFKHEVYLTYRRLQDIHVTRNIVERWLGLAKLPIQTASGTSGATMTIEGVPNPEALRDYLYQRMRGARATDEEPAEAEDAGESVVGLLRDIRDELRRRRAGEEA